MTNRISKKFQWISIIFISGWTSVLTGIEINAQSMQRVNHLSGEQIINDIMVTVTSKGQTALLWTPNLCDGETGPYFIGYNTVDYTCTNGSYTFTFSPPVSEVKLNFTGLSSSNVYDEEMIVFVNGNHYDIPEPGTLNSCEKLAYLTNSGNVTGCYECSTSGWNDTRIKGPIYTLTVLDSVIKGEPAGALFALYMGWLSLENDLSTKVRAYKKESAGGFDLIIETDSLDLKLMSIQGPTGEKMEFNSYTEIPFITVDISNFIKEQEYTLELRVKNILLSKKITIW